MPPSVSGWLQVHWGSRDLDGEAGVERLEAALARIREEEFDRLPSQHSLNCLASIGEVKLSPQVSLVAGSFQ